MQTTTTVLPPTVLFSQSTVYASQGHIYALDEGGTVRQSYPTPGLAYPTVVDDLLYLNVSCHPDYLVQALRVSDGSLLWSYPVHGRLAGAPVVAEGVVYACLVEGMLYALEASTGHVLWSTLLDSGSERPPAGGPFVFSSPVVEGGVVYLATAVNPPLVPCVYALRGMDGMLLWKVKTSGSTRFRLATANNIVYQNTPRGCCVLDGSSGTLIWQVDTGARVSSPPLVLHGMVILCLRETQYDHAHFLVSGEMRQWHESFLCALAAQDGVELWRVPLGVDQGTDHSLAASHSHRAIYVSTGEGTLAAFQAESGSPLWHYKTGGTLLSAPGEANGVVYVGANDGCVYALRASEGALLWRTFVSTAVTTVSAISAVSIHHLKTSNSQGQDNELC